MIEYISILWELIKTVLGFLFIGGFIMLGLMVILNPIAMSRLEKKDREFNDKIKRDLFQ